VRGAMEQVLSLLSQRQGNERIASEKPPSLLGNMKAAAESLEAKQLLQEMKL